MDKKGLIQEIKLKAVRSSGPGGQHVNKVSTKVELTFDIENSTALSLLEKGFIYNKLASRLTKDNVLILQSDESRSQHKNKEIITKRFLDIIAFALKVPKKRRKTKALRSII